MGYNTTVLILNDGFDQLVKHPADFVDAISTYLHNGGSVGVGNHANCVQVMRSEHADTFRLYASQANLMVELSPYAEATKTLAATHPNILRAHIAAGRGTIDALDRMVRDLYKR